MKYNIIMKKVLFVLMLFYVFSGVTIAGGTSIDFFYDDSSNDASSSDESSSDESSSDESSNDASSSDESSNDANSNDANSNDDAIIMQHTKGSCSRDVKKPLFTRETTPEYFSTYLGGIVNQQSLKEFFNITNNQYRSTCDAWYRKYLNSQFNKALVFAYDHKNIKGVTSYWGFSNNSPSRRMAEQHALQACEASDVKIESHICAILFSNNEITNKDYFALAKLVIPE